MNVFLTIRERRDALYADLKRAQGAVERVQFELKMLRRECSHPNAFATTHMGENCRDCPDCGAHNGF